MGQLRRPRRVTDETVRETIAFARDCCDRDAMGIAATTEGIKGQDVRDPQVAAVERASARSPECRRRSNGCRARAG